MIEPAPSSVTQYERHLAFERCFNARDLGGYATAGGGSVRWRRLFRSMTPQWMTPADLQQARDLGIELVIDLRTAEHPTSGPLGEPPARRINVGLVRNSGPQNEEQQRFMTLSAIEGIPATLEKNAPSFARAVSEIAATDGPVLYHCRLGKDRTGVLSAVLLKLLGVSDADVIEDYMATLAREPDVRALLEQLDPDPPDAEAPPFVREPVQAQAMVATLARLQSEFGGARSYLVQQGVQAAALDALVARLLQ